MTTIFYTFENSFTAVVRSDSRYHYVVKFANDGTNKWYKLKINVDCAVMLSDRKILLASMEKDMINTICL